MAETWNSVEMCRLLMKIWHHHPAGQDRDDLKRLVARLERHCTERGCPTCHSTFYNFEEPGEP